MDFLNFVSHDQQYAVRLDETIAAIVKPELTSVPGTIPCIVGIFSYHGELIPVIDLSILYGGSEEVDPGFVVIVQGNCKYGILATKINAIIRRDVPVDVLFLSVHDIENTVMHPESMSSNSAHIELF